MACSLIFCLATVVLTPFEAFFFFRFSFARFSEAGDGTEPLLLFLVAFES